MYHFTKQDAFSFARRQMSNVREKGNELQFDYCPYCGGGKHRDKGSFSINLETGQYNCLRNSCAVQGNFITLSRDFNFPLENVTFEHPKRYRKFGTKKVQTKEEAVIWLNKRGISEKTTKHYEITVATKKNILVFPFFDGKSILQFIKYRNMDFKKGVDKNKEWCEPNCMPILFGMKQCNDKFERLVITEGQIDSLSIAEAGIENAVSVPNGAKGFTWIPNCWEWFSKFRELVVFGDLEQGEMTLLEELKKRFPHTIRAVRKEDYKGCKDANEILIKYGKEAIIRAVQNARIIPIKAVKELADVKAVDIYNMPNIKTGIKHIDYLIGGLYYSQVILLTGKRGDGKSTFMGQLIVNALEQGKKVFAYSGELQDYFFKRWLDMQIAGRRNIIENTRVDGTKSYLLPNSKVDKINDWYRERMYIYDNNLMEEEGELEDLLKTIEKAVMQYGIDFVCIDNLMTAMEVSMRDDLYRAQSKFVHNLCKLAKRLNIVILLVAHPRKSGLIKEANEEVSGSADITNRVDVVLTYKRPEEEDCEENERRLIISKNRLTGHLTKKEGIPLFYDSISKRIVGEEEDFLKRYGWEEIEDFIEVKEEEIPF